MGMCGAGSSALYQRTRRSAAPRRSALRSTAAEMAGGGGKAAATTSSSGSAVEIGHRCIAYKWQSWGIGIGPESMCIGGGGGDSARLTAAAAADCQARRRQQLAERGDGLSTCSALAVWCRRCRAPTGCSEVRVSALTTRVLRTLRSFEAPVPSRAQLQRRATNVRAAGGRRTAVADWARIADAPYIYCCRSGSALSRATRAGLRQPGRFGSQAGLESPLVANLVALQTSELCKQAAFQSREVLKSSELFFCAKCGWAALRAVPSEETEADRDTHRAG